MHEIIKKINCVCAEMAACLIMCMCIVFHCMHVFTVFNRYEYRIVQRYTTKGIDDVALNKKIKFVCLFVCS